MKLADEITSLAESLGVDSFAEFFKEVAAMDLEGHRVEMFELAPRCPPHGGYYVLGEDNKEWGWYIHQILTYYRAFGPELDVKKELPDYMPAMLEFLGATRAVDDLGRRSMRRDFYLRFMKPWLDKFSQCIERAESPYRHLAKALSQLLELDFEAPP